MNMSTSQKVSLGLSMAVLVLTLIAAGVAVYRQEWNLLVWITSSILWMGLAIFHEKRAFELTFALIETTSMLRVLLQHVEERNKNIVETSEKLNAASAMLEKHIEERTVQ